MKIGDIVRQNNEFVQIRNGAKEKVRSKLIGVVVDIRSPDPPKKVETEMLRSWMDSLGRLVDVLWSNGNLSKNFAENALEVIEDNDKCKTDKKLV